jgi:hypothetical protein
MDCLKSLLSTTLSLIVLLSSCTLLPNPKQICPKPSNEERTFSSSENSPSVSTLRTEIENYLNSGYDVEGLRSLTLDKMGNTVGSITKADLSGDENDELILSTITSSEISGYKLGWLGIYECSNGKYQPTYIGYGEFTNSVKVIKVFDTLGQGKPQIFVEYIWRGSQCQVGLNVLVKTDTGWSRIFDHYLNCPTTISLNNSQDGDTVEIIFQGKFHDDMGFEPDKRVTQVFRVESGEIVLVP